MKKSSIKKYLYFSAGAVALLILFLLLVLPKVLDTAPIKNKLQLQIQQTTSLNVKIMGPIKISFIPKTSIRCMDLTLTGEKESFTVSVKEAHIDVGLMALLRKAIIIKQIYLLSPYIKIDLQKLNIAKTSPIADDTKVPYQDSPKIQDFQMTNLKIEDGKFLFVQESKEHLFENINLKTHLLSFFNNTKITGNFDYKGIKSNFELTSSPLNAFIDGNELLISIKFDSKNIFEAILTLTFKKVETGYKYTIKGDINTKDISALGKILDINTSKLKLNNSNIHLTVEGQKDKINLDMSWGVGNQKLFLDGYYLPLKSYGSLRLRSGFLNLDDLLYLDGEKTSKDLTQKQGPSEVKPHKGRTVKSVSFDFSVLVERIFYNGKKLEDIKVSAKYADEKIEIDQASFNLWDGATTIKGKYGLTDKTFRGNLQIKNLSLYETLKEIAQYTDMTGKINANVNISSSQNVSSQFLTNIVAQGNLLLKQGTIRNNKKLIDVANIIGFLSGEIEKKESVSYEINSMQFKFKEGKVFIDQGDLSSDLGDAFFFGDVNILSKQLEIVAKPRNLKLLTKNPFVSIKIYGPFSDVKVRPEFKALPREGLKDLVDPLKQRLFKLREDLR